MNLEEGINNILKLAKENNLEPSELFDVFQKAYIPHRERYGSCLDAPDYFELMYDRIQYQYDTVINYVNLKRGTK